MIIAPHPPRGPAYVSSRTIRIIRTIAFVVVLTMGPLPIGTARAQTKTLEVVEYAWTSEVRELEHVDDLGPDIGLRNPLYLWLRVEADAAALKELEARGMLPIRHRWIHRAGEDTRSERGELIDEIRLGVGKAALIPRLTRELADDGRFDWRTWSMKERLRRGDWTVEVVYSDPNRTPLACRSRNGGGSSPCQFHIVVR